MGLCSILEITVERYNYFMSLGESGRKSAGSRCDSPGQSTEGMVGILKEQTLNVMGQSLRRV